MEISKQYSFGYERYVNKSFVRFRNTKADIINYLSSVTDDVAMKLDIINHCVCDYLTNCGLYNINAKNQNTAKNMVVISYFKDGNYHIKFCEYNNASNLIDSIIASENVAVNSSLKTLVLGLMSGSMPIDVFSRAIIERTPIKSGLAFTNLKEFFKNEEVYTLTLS